MADLTKRDFRMPNAAAFGRRALIFAYAGIVISIAGFVIDRGYLYHSYLISWAFWLTLGLGGLFFTMLHHLVNATWSVVLRRISENMMVTLVLLAILFIPIIFGIKDLYSWSHSGLANPVIREKSSYLNIGFFLTRALIFLGIWVMLAWRLYKMSLAQDKGFSENGIMKIRRLSAPGMILFAFTLTFAAFDWFMSLDAKWYSTAFGVYIFSGGVLSALAFMTLIAIYLKNNGVLADALTLDHFHDLGKLLFTFTVFWAYIAFAQYFLIWYGNIPEETVWYHQRWNGSWKFVSLLIVFGHFVLPFIALISRAAKKNLTSMKLISVWLLFMHWVDLYWVIMPNHAEAVLQNLWIDIGTMFAIGGITIWYFGRKLSSQPVVPIGDPNLEASFHLVSD